MCNVIEVWACKNCGWQGLIRKGHQWTFRILPEGETQGPFTHFPDLIEALRKSPKGDVIVTVEAQCPECDSWETTKRRRSD